MSDTGAGEKKTTVTYMKWTEPQTIFMMDLVKTRFLYLEKQNKPGTSSSTTRRTTAPMAQRFRRTRTIRTATSFSATPRGGAALLPRHAQPLLLLFRSNLPLRGGENQKPLWRSHVPSRPPARQRGGESIFWALDATLY